jgi:hypothetical protein
MNHRGEPATFPWKRCGLAKRFRIGSLVKKANTGNCDVKKCRLIDDGKKSVRALQPFDHSQSAGVSARDPVIHARPGTNKKRHFSGNKVFFPPGRAVSATLLRMVSGLRDKSAATRCSVAVLQEKLGECRSRGLKRFHSHEKGHARLFTPLKGCSPLSVAASWCGLASLNQPAQALKVGGIETVSRTKRDERAPRTHGVADQPTPSELSQCVAKAWLKTRSPAWCCRCSHLSGEVIAGLSNRQLFRSRPDRP